MTVEDVLEGTYDQAREWLWTETLITSSGRRDLTDAVIRERVDAVYPGGWPAFEDDHEGTGS